MSILDHETHHGPDSGVSQHLTPYSILCDSPRHPRGDVTFSRDSRDSRVRVSKLSRVESRDSRDSRVGVRKLSRNYLGWSPATPATPGLESRNCPETVPGGVPGLWELITPDCKVWSRRGLNQNYSPSRDLSNDVLYSQFGGREEVDSRLLVDSRIFPNWQFDSRPFFCP
jgi:hypothetical protein